MSNGRNTVELNHFNLMNAKNFLSPDGLPIKLILNKHVEILIYKIESMIVPFHATSGINNVIQSSLVNNSWLLKIVGIFLFELEYYTFIRVVRRFNSLF